jgi:hypothetical protein
VQVVQEAVVLALQTEAQQDQADQQILAAVAVVGKIVHILTLVVLVDLG